MSSCKKCKAELTISETELYKDDFYCKSCLDTILAERGPEEDVPALEVPACFVCGNEIPAGLAITYSGKSYCASCYEKHTHMEPPLAIKLFLAFLVCAAVAGMFVNGRYYRALFSLKNASRHLVSGDIDEASKLSAAALSLVPKNADVQLMDKFYRGLSYFAHRNYVDALPLMKEYSRFHPDDRSVSSIILYAEIALAFDERKYMLMRDKARELHELNPVDESATLSYASSLACVYVAENDVQARDLAEKLMDGIGAASRDNADTMDEIRRIEHRIRARMIVSREEYGSMTREEKK